MIAMYSIPVLYILADSMKSLLGSVVQSNNYFVPQSMQVMSALCGCTFANVMTFRKFGVDGLRRAWNPRMIFKCLLCGLLQALTGSLTGMAYSMRTSPAMVAALGKIYTPLVAIFSRFILGKFFMWLEWFA